MPNLSTVFGKFYDAVVLLFKITVVLGVFVVPLLALWKLVEILIWYFR